MMLAAECGYLKRYSPIARGVMSIGGAVFILVIMLAATLVARRI